MMKLFLILAAVCAVVAFCLVVLRAYRKCKLRRDTNRQCLQPEERNYD